MAMRTFPLDIAIGEKSAASDTVILLHLLLPDVPLVVEFQEKILRDFMVQQKRSAGVIVKKNTETPKAFLYCRMVSVHDLLRRNTLAIGANRNRDTVLVGAADENDIAPPEPLVPDVNIRRNVGPGQMAQVQGPVGVWKGGGYKHFFRHCITPESVNKELNSITCPKG
jgi:hypothetical protein